MIFLNAKGTDLRILVLKFEAINSREELITFRVAINLTQQIANNQQLGFVWVRDYNPRERFSIIHRCRLRDIGVGTRVGQRGPWPPQSWALCV